MTANEALTLTDPVWDEAKSSTWFSRLCTRFIRDERDAPFVRLALWLSLLLIPLAAYLFLAASFPWWAAAVYWAVYTYYLGPFILMLHNTSHRVLFKPEYEVLNNYIPWVVGTLVGQSPETYYAHHMGMHHVEGNLPADLSTTLPYQRDRFRDFLKYYGRFMAGYPDIIRYFRRNKRPRMLRRFVAGEAFYLSLTAVALVVDWKAALVVFVGPLLFTRFMLMAGNWGQHAFVDTKDPADDYRTVITFINSNYNHRCFNDGYHLGHHLKASRHWLEMPADFLEKKPEMIAKGSLVFTRLDYFMIFALLMLKRYRTLARYVVQLDTEQPMSEGEIVALLKSRVRKLEPAELDALSAPRSAAA